ncbi:DUF3135 domain-containing protein [Granulosicoccus antarcticus]|nr:DUF3135 domain-containing protein [Granulosicoccus antarcticus]
MRQNNASEFDFDDWAGLYLENPQEFEARRQATLMIEMTRGSSENATASRALLDAYEKAAKGCSPAQRMKIASEMMMESAHQLSAELQILKQTLEQLDLDVPAPDSDSVSSPEQVTSSN